MSFRSFYLPFTIILGILLPSFGAFSWLISPLLSLLLFLSFLQFSFSFSVFHEKKIFLVVLLNVLLGVGAGVLFSFFSRDIGITAFLVSIAPTASAAPAVIAMLGGDIAFITASLLLSTLTCTLLMPFLLFFLFQTEGISLVEMGINIGEVILLPLVLAQGIRFFFPAFVERHKKISRWSFWIWGIAVLLAMAKTSAYLWALEKNSLLSTLLAPAGLAFFLCFVHFFMGKKAGGVQYSREMSQSLGQKNTLLVTWVALHFYTPAIALGPIFYIIAHNLYNSFQIFHYERTIRKNT
ncbi:MAG: hypothetical protein WCJ84_04165 [Candidatus Peregrinibacteria bacterium]